MTLRGMMKFAAGAALGLLIGALAGRSLAQAPAGGTGGARYQYKCITGIEGKIYKPGAVEALNREGAQGWQLLPADQNHYSGMDQYCFIREVR